jgi:hypothetical protein
MRQVSFQSREYKRACAEESYYRARRMDFIKPWIVEELDEFFGYQISVRQIDGRYTKRKLSDLSTIDCQNLCGKDVPLYLIPEDKRIPSASQLFDIIYRHFFPHRDLALDISHNHFFAQPLALRIEKSADLPTTLAALHETLCAKVIEETAGLDVRLSSTFKSIILIAEELQAPQPSVLVVCKDIETAEKLHLFELLESNTVDMLTGSHDDTSKDWSICFRVGLIQAMDRIFALDIQREQGTEPNSIFWQREILDQDDFEWVD